MSAQPKVIYSAANTQQAYLLKGLLEDRGIRAQVVNDSIQIAGGDLPLGWTSAARVVVGDDDAIKARQVAEDFDRRTNHEPTADDASDPVTTEWADWPRCPSCGEKRAARCPVCGVSGSDFPLADITEDDDPNRVLLLCQACDDHVLPEWYRLCPRCGYDYQNGISVESSAPQAFAMNGPLWFVLAILVGGACALIAYFAWLLT